MGGEDEDMHMKCETNRTKMKTMMIPAWIETITIKKALVRQVGELPPGAFPASPSFKKTTYKV